MENDRSSMGFFAGVLAAIAMNIVDWLAYSLNLYQERLLNWGSMAVFGRLPANAAEVIFAQLVQIFFSGILGMIFAALLLKMASPNLLLKSWIYGILTWFLIYAVAIAFRIPNLETRGFASALGNLISASVYGLVLGMALNILEKRANT